MSTSILGSWNVQCLDLDENKRTFTFAKNGGKAFIWQRWAHMGRVPLLGNSSFAKMLGWDIDEASHEASPLDFWDPKIKRLGSLKGSGLVILFVDLKNCLGYQENTRQTSRGNRHELWCDINSSAAYQNAMEKWKRQLFGWTYPMNPRIENVTVGIWNMRTPSRPKTLTHDINTLRIMGSQNWWFGDPGTLLYRFRPLYRRVQWFLG